MKKHDHIQVGQEVIRIESEAVRSLLERIDADFALAVDAILACTGRVIVTGMGKAGLIAQKIASTLASTGTPSMFIHPGDAAHGDLGMVTRADIILALSNSGETNEIIQILSVFRRLGLKTVSFVGRKNSSVARLSDVALDTSVKREACTLDLAPTASTSAMLAMGDALAVALLEARGFRQEDFALLHPSGTLGRKLLLTVDQIMHTGDEMPLVARDTTVRDTLFTISAKGLGMAGVVDDQGRLVGIITDGDIRRGFEKGDQDIFNKQAEILMSRTPHSVPADMLAINALEVMENYSITSLFVYRAQTDVQPVGIVHIHDILKSGII